MFNTKHCFEKNHPDKRDMHDGPILPHLSPRYILQYLEAQFIEVILGRKLDRVKAWSIWNNIIWNLWNKSHHLKRGGRKAFVESLFRGHDLHPGVTVLCTLLVFVASVSVRLESKELQGDNGASFLFWLFGPIFRAGKLPKIPFLGISLLPNPTETLATQDLHAFSCLFFLPITFIFFSY